MPNWIISHSAADPDYGYQRFGDTIDELVTRRSRGADMTTGNAQQSVLVFGRSQLVLDNTVAGLRDLGYTAQATNDFFSDITGRFDFTEINLVVLGTQVSPDRQAELKEEIGAINPRTIFIEALAGIPGLIINQVKGAFAVGHQDPAQAPTYAPDDRSIRLTLANPADVRVTVA